MEYPSCQHIEQYLVPGKRCHLVGIGGVSMRPLGLVLRRMGMEISGSDMNASVSTDELIAKGIQVSIGHRAENIEGADCLICRDETGRVHPVCAIYRRQALPVVTGQLQAGDFRMMHLLANLKTDHFSVAAAQMQNANTPEIWSEIQKNEHA